MRGIILRYFLLLCSDDIHGSHALRESNDLQIEFVIATMGEIHQDDKTEVE